MMLFEARFVAQPRASINMVVEYVHDHERFKDYIGDGFLEEPARTCARCIHFDPKQTCNCHGARSSPR